jgi:adenosylcobinamide-GDP ribazoletransferase
MKQMKKEWKIFLTAVMYFTRVRVPATIDHRAEYLQKASRYFPLTGILVGSACSLVFLIFARYISVDIGILASMIAGLLITGAFHEDGFADTCDGFGGGWTKEKILLIMKDSRIGAFGAIGLIAVLGSKFLLLKELPQFTPELVHTGNTPGGSGPSLPPAVALFYNYRFFILALVAAHSVSRLMPVLVVRWSEYTADPDLSKSKPLITHKMRFPELTVVTLSALAPFVLLPWHFLLAILPVLYVAYEMRAYFKKWIGGYTGDCLGAVQQVSEIVFYLGYIIVWRYM